VATTGSVQDCRFGPFRLDVRDQRLWRGTDELPLRPKTFAVLAHLVAQAGRLVSREELLEAVWPGVVVSEVVLTVCIREIRQALGDDSQAARYVETRHRRGYRFMAPVTAARAAIGVTGERSGTAPLVGRGAELAHLQGALDAAVGGRSAVVFVTGEAGIGKSSLVNAFLERVGPGVWCARGQCIDHYGAGEAYLPVLDALGRLSRQLGGGPLEACLRRYAPTWLSQMPALLGAADEPPAPRPGADGGRHRMLRELAEALEALTADHPLILVLEDLHWSDFATVDLVSWLAQRGELARLLVIGTYRPAELIVREHPLLTVKQELARHGRCVELPLELFTEAEVGQHLDAKFGGGQEPAPLHPLARTIHQRTDGHPLFLVTLVDALVRAGWLVEGEGRWEVRDGVETVALEVPSSLQDLVDQQFRQLGAEDQHLLQVASVVGLEGSAAAIAAGLGDDVVVVEERCAALARRGQFLQSSGSEEWPDGTLAGRYRFRHTLYRQVVYDRIPVGRRVQLHARVGERQEAGYGPGAVDHAAELAAHFEEGRTYERARHYRRRAADRAMRRHAYQEAIGHLRRALALLSRVPDGPARAREELEGHLVLGQALSAVHGPAASAVGEVYQRAQALGPLVEDAPTRLLVLQGLRRYCLGRADVQRARALGEEILELTQRLEDPALVRKAHAALGTCLLYLGALRTAGQHLVQGIAGHDSESHSSPADLDADTVCRTSVGMMLWLLGYPEQALAEMDKALALARTLAVPLIEVSVLSHAAVVHQFRREVERTRERAEAAVKLATKHGFSLWGAHAAMLHGWALAMQGNTADGIAQIRGGLEVWRTNEQRLGQPYLLALLGETYGQAGQAEAGLEVLSESLAIVNAHDLRMYEAEVHRLKGQLLATIPGGRREAEACFGQAIETARRQEARSLELRAAVSLCRLGSGRGRKPGGRRMLAGIYAQFTEGFDTVDLREARALLT
jgi:DNA-binding winged helix-turn-helix (wHTH) protein/predicted ATPase